jgi:phosphonate transport system substrate-binding protein
MMRAAMRPEPLRFTSCQAPIAEAFGAGVASYVGQSLGTAVEFVDEIPWPERLREFDAGRIHVCWMCGLPYVWRTDRLESSVELLAAPVAAGPRYADRPVYFSDVVVRHDSSWSSFAALEGASWAFNEETSHSGYNVIRHRLAQMGRDRAFYGNVVASGSHEASLRRLLDRDVDATAIDSTVLDLLHRRDASLASQIRVIETFGPSPSPPWVVAPTVPRALRAEIREALLAMSDDPGGRDVLRSGMVSRFAMVTDADSDPIRRMAREAEHIDL